MGDPLTEAAALRARAEILPFYSPYNFLRAVPAAAQVANFVRPRVEAHLAAEGPHRSFRVLIDGQSYYFLYTLLVWDATFFGRPVLRLYTVLYAAVGIERLVRAARAFYEAVVAVGPQTHCFIELPSEDVYLAQALGRAGFGLVETRCFFYHDAVAAHCQPRYKVRRATVADAVRVGEVAALARNAYDRFHADAYLPPADADRFLQAYAEAAVKGYCDAVLVPAETGVPLDSFLAISDLKSDAVLLGAGLARVVLTAVGPANRGWHLKLVSETLHYARERGATYALMTTQSTNRAVFRTAEKLGWKLGGMGHVLAIGTAY